MKRRRRGEEEGRPGAVMVEEEEGCFRSLFYFKFLNLSLGLSQLAATCFCIFGIFGILVLKVSAIFHFIVCLFLIFIVFFANACLLELFSDL